MSQELQEKILKSIDILRKNENKIFFLTQDTKGNAKAGIKHIYDIAMSLKNSGFNPIILHEKKEYDGVAGWLGEEYMSEIPHQNIEEQKLQVSPEDILVIPELFAHALEQVSNLPCAKIVLCQAYDYALETLAPGSTWIQFGTYKAITTSETQKNYLSSIFKSVSIDVLEPIIYKGFTKKQKPPLPVVTIHTRDQRDAMKIIKTFYLKYPQYRWITFRDMRGLSLEEFAQNLKESFVSVWVDDNSAFGSFPLESMISGTPVIGKIPHLRPEWMNETNGVWTTEYLDIVDTLAEFTQNWLEDNISEEIYTAGYETAQQYVDYEKFNKNIFHLFNEYNQLRLQNFESQVEKIKNESEQ